MTRQITDSHVHLIDPARCSYPWLPDLGAWRQPHDAARYAVDVPEITGAVVVEAGVMAGQADRETCWMRAQAAAHPWIRGLVVHAPVERPGALGAMLAGYRDDSMIAGVRRNLQDETQGYLRDPCLRAGVRRLGEAGLPFDACVRARQLRELSELAAACPDTVIVLDHLGKPRCGSDLSDWRAALRGLAAHPNLRCKLSGLATEAAPGARPGSLLTALRWALDVFGPDRCLYGSDWPVCTLAGSHWTWLGLVLTALDSLAAGEQEDVLGGTAQRTYRLPPVPATSPHKKTGP
jgi:L-fuconolactonase